MEFPIKNNIKALENGRNPAAIAQEIGMSRATYYRIRSGMYVPTIFRVKMICEYFGKGFEEVFPGMAISLDRKSEDVPMYEDREVF